MKYQKAGLHTISVMPYALEFYILRFLLAGVRRHRAVGPLLRILHFSNHKMSAAHSPRAAGVHFPAFFAFFISQASIISSLNRHWLPTLNPGSFF